MDDTAALRKAVSLIATGLYEKEQQKQKGKYCNSKKFIHGINIFWQLNYKYNPGGFKFHKMHEQGFIADYAMRPVYQWFEGWENTKQLDLEKQGFYYMDALVSDSGFHTFHVSEACEEYLNYVESDTFASIEQRVVYDYLKTLKQEEYVNLRRYFIEHPIITSEELRKLKLTCVSSEAALCAIENAYEEIMEDCFICPRCGWTLRKEKTGMRCQNRSCGEEKYLKGELEAISGETGMFRLKRGVMKYIAVPGKLELEIYQYCKKYKVKSELWPGMDLYDIGMRFQDGEEWAIDAKAIKEPYFLRTNIIRDGGFPAGEYKRGLYVIPDAYANERKDYLDIVNRQLERMGDRRIQCVRVCDLKKEIRERSSRT